MNQSKPGAKLNPELKAAVDAIYQHDTMRYCGIARWVWWCQMHGWPDEAIAEACRMANPNCHAVRQWWPYLTKMLPKAKARATATESDNHKRADMAIVSEFVAFLESKRANNGKN